MKSSGIIGDRINFKLGVFLPLDVRSLIKKELSEPEGFKSYEEVRTWLLAVEGIEASYNVVH